MWVIFLLSACAFALVALIISLIAWWVIHKMESEMYRDDEKFNIEKEVYTKIKNNIKKED